MCSTPVVIRGSSPYGNFLADEEPDAQPHHFTDNGRVGAESSLSMVSDYTLSYGTDALEPARMVMGQDGRFVPSYVALDRKVLRFHVYFRDPRGPIGYTVSAPAPSSHRPAIRGARWFAADLLGEMWDEGFMGSKSAAGLRAMISQYSFYHRH